MDLIPLESNLHKYDLVIISQIINMIETDSFWHRKMFESVMSDLQNLWMEGICKLENVPMHCTNNEEKDAEMDEVEFIDLCSIGQNNNKVHGEGKESTKQESQDKMKSDAMARMEDKLMTKKSKSATQKDQVEFAMMCSEATSNFPEEEPHKEPEKVEKKPVEKMGKPKHEEEHVEPTLNTGNQLKISIKEFSWEREDDGSTLDTEEPEQQQLVYI